MYVEVEGTVEPVTILLYIALIFSMTSLSPSSGDDLPSLFKKPEPSIALILTYDVLGIELAKEMDFLSMRRMAILSHVIV